MKALIFLGIVALVVCITFPGYAVSSVQLNGQVIAFIVTHDTLTLTCNSASGGTVVIAEYVDTNGNRTADAGEPKEFETTVTDNGPDDGNAIAGQIRYFFGPFDGGGNYVVKVTESTTSATAAVTVSAATIMGRITDSTGAGVNGAWVFLDSIDYSTSFQADSQGYYKAYVRTGSWSIFVSYDTAISPVNPISVTIGNTYTGKDFKMSNPVGYVIGTVTDQATSRPISGAIIAATDASYNYYDTLSKYDGTYRLAVPAASYTVEGSAFGYTVSAVAKTVGSGQTLTQNFALTRQASISGRVVDGSGNPVMGARVSATEASLEDTTDGNGNYIISGLMAGTYTVVVSDPLACNPTERSVPLTTGQAVTGINFTLPNVASIDGIVYQGTTGMPDAAVSAYNTLYNTQSDDAGGYHLLVDEGYYLITAVMGTATGAGKPIHVRKGQHLTGVDLYLTIKETIASPANFIQIGWNLFSLPGMPENPDPVAVLTGINVANASLQYWDNVTSGGGYRGYPLDWTKPIMPMSPYWLMELGSTRQISFQGYPYNTTQTIVIPSSDSAPRWIMFGYPFKTLMSCDNVRFTSTSNQTPLTWQQAYDAHLVESSAQGFDAMNSRFFSAGPSTYITDRHILEPWFGYWLLLQTAEEVTITLPK